MQPCHILTRDCGGYWHLRAGTVDRPSVHNIIRGFAIALFSPTELVERHIRLAIIQGNDDLGVEFVGQIKDQDVADIFAATANEGKSVIQHALEKKMLKTLDNVPVVLRKQLLRGQKVSNIAPALCTKPFVSARFC